MKSIRRLLGRSALVVVSLLVMTAGLEMTLRLWPTLLGRAFANGAMSKYTSKQGGIYYYDPSLRMQFMVPGYRTTMYYNGYVWRHETDSMGFRNNPLHIPADVMLIGDSVVYGHGVDFEHTLGYYLEHRSRLRVANLGRQGDCAYQEAYLLTVYLPVFKPRFVVQVFTPNDIEDLYVYLNNEEMERFVARPFDRITYPPRIDANALMTARERDARNRTIWERVTDELYVGKMLHWIEDAYRRRQASVAMVSVAEAASSYDIGVNVDPTSIGWRYTAHALGYMKYRAALAGVRFLMAPIAYGRQLEILRQIAHHHDIEIVDLKDLSNGPSFLPNDGHLSPHGARRMADLIAAHLERR